MCMALEFYSEHVFIGRFPSFDYMYCYGAPLVIYACSSTTSNTYTKYGFSLVEGSSDGLKTIK